ncbi:ABR213Wp [Eremothecium gossypii ATCC 10895]|uniref:ABR213Wp n=1 Tax=Eremothecium gossypii (strain ATCC 10895 / CBS 109.51 / FGSC 9923 / NRRL Y-1056) TaxID=284811 RepID=Q75D09_EREGS|nr:ABR213Wp [Eremothecium gossypii ATCC 10895]AAS50986.1 ABR213Wp [Eremothecium gossypii ATCC 10895]AEY95275.1 FABR213Wp [Eremothecium gossypii FDAG1]
MTLDQEYTKLVSRRDELQKQEVTLRREFTTLVRKIASITAVLETIESPQVIERNLPSDEVLQKAPGLQPLIEMLVTLDETPLAEIEIPEKLMHSYELFRNTPLLYKDNPGHL